MNKTRIRKITYMLFILNLLLLLFLEFFVKGELFISSPQIIELFTNIQYGLVVFFILLAIMFLYIKDDKQINNEKENNYKINNYSSKLKKGFWIVFIIAVIIRLYLVYNGNINYDSGFTLYDAHNLGNGLLPRIDYPGRDPGHHFIVYWYSKIVGNNLITARLLYALFWAIQGFMILYIGKKFFKKDIGYMAAMLYFASPAVIYAYQPRNIPFLIFFLGLTLICFFHYMDSKKLKYLIFAGLFIFCGYMMRKSMFLWLGGLGFFIFIYNMFRGEGTDKERIIRTLKEGFTLLFSFAIPQIIFYAFYAYPDAYGVVGKQIFPFLQTAYFQEKTQVAEKNSLGYAVIQTIMERWYFFIPIITYIFVGKKSEIKLNISKIFKVITYLLFIVFAVVIITLLYSFDIGKDNINIKTVVIPYFILSIFTILFLFSLALLTKQIISRGEMDFWKNPKNLLLVFLFILVLILYLKKGKFLSGYVFEVTLIGFLLAAKGFDKLKDTRGFRHIGIIYILLSIFTTFYYLIIDTKSRNLTMDSFQEVSAFVEENLGEDDILFSYNVLYNYETGKENILNIGRGYYGVNEKSPYKVPKSYNYSSKDIIKFIKENNVEYSIYDWRMQTKLLSRNPEIEAFYFHYFNEVVLDITVHNTWSSHEIQVRKHTIKEDKKQSDDSIDTVLTGDIIEYLDEDIN